MNTSKSWGDQAMQYPKIQGETNSSKKIYLRQNMDEERLDAVQVGEKSK